MNKHALCVAVRAGVGTLLLIFVVMSAFALGALFHPGLGFLLAIATGVGIGTYYLNN